ncbi:hypothetical protein AAF712_014697 [Marasmius tenuissimus]|uniref:Uncharacterized protein n=1 Tax=Marasmius tenuissimus TaxID=585030 RepID=A0ABR2ZAC8_9AGAR
MQTEGVVPVFGDWGHDWQSTFVGLDWNIIQSLGDDSSGEPPVGHQMSLGTGESYSNPRAGRFLDASAILPSVPISRKTPEDEPSLTFANEFTPPPPCSPARSSPVLLPTSSTKTSGRAPSASQTLPYLPPVEPRGSVISDDRSTSKTQGRRELFKKLTQAPNVAERPEAVYDRENKEKFDNAVLVASNNFKERLTKIAEDNSREPEEALSLAWAQTRVKQPRKVSGHNALLHHARKQENDANPFAMKKKLCELTEIVNTDPHYLKIKMDPAQMRKITQELEEERAMKKGGDRTSNGSITQDIRKPFDCMRKDMEGNEEESDTEDPEMVDDVEGRCGRSGKMGKNAQSKKRKVAGNSEALEGVSKKRRTKSKNRPEAANKPPRKQASFRLPRNVYKSKEILSDTDGSDYEPAPHNTSSLAITTPAAPTNTSRYTTEGQV